MPKVCYSSRDPLVLIYPAQMMLARDLLSVLLSTAPTDSTNPASLISQSANQYPPVDHLTAGSITATTVKKPPPIPSVAAFNAQLSLSYKDTSLRKAAGLFRKAAKAVSETASNNDKYWNDALKVKEGNWGMIAAPLPYGGAQLQGRGADRSAKDFLISYGLEDCMSGHLSFL
jgi:mediator of RNA polymerase II transcription subunit 17, fungi type